MHTVEVIWGFLMCDHMQISNGIETSVNYCVAHNCFQFLSRYTN